MRTYVCVCVCTRTYEREPSHGECARAPFDNLLHITEDSFGADREGARERDATITGRNREREGSAAATRRSEREQATQEKRREGEKGGGREERDGKSRSDVYFVPRDKVLLNGNDPTDFLMSETRD